MEEKFIPYQRENPSELELRSRAEVFYNRMNKRRAVRVFSEQTGPKDVISNIIKAAATWPSGAHKQPWVFCAISNSDLKSKIREAAELMQVQQDLKLEGIDRSKDNRGTVQKLAEYYQSKDGGEYSKEVSISMARNIPTTISEYFTASKASTDGGKLYDATRAATEDDIFGENLEYRGKIDKKKYKKDNQYFYE